jgi:3-methyladenine DNA glycosylase AlkD
MRITEGLACLHTMGRTDQSELFGRFFKTGKGEYGEGDQFIGVMVPEVRQLVKACTEYSLEEIVPLLKDPIHEIRLFGGLLLVKLYEREKPRREEIVSFYLEYLPCLNNWDLIDLTCYKILGDWLLSNDRNVLYQMVENENLWVQRASIVSTMSFVRKGELEDTFRIAERLLDHPHDLMHKAVGWLLRECGKRDLRALDLFLEKYAEMMPRTTLRYAIEKHPEPERKQWLARKRVPRNTLK